MTPGGEKARPVWEEGAGVERCIPSLVYHAR